MSTEKSKYKVEVRGNDPFGISFLQKVVEFANKGATLDPTHRIRMEFPHQCVMLVESEDKLGVETDNGAISVQPIPINLVYSREELMGMKMPELQEVCKKYGIAGRIKEQLVRQYLEAQEKEKEDDKEDGQ